MKANSLHEAIDDKDGLDENMAIVINLNKFMLNDETVTNLVKQFKKCFLVIGKLF